MTGRTLHPIPDEWKNTGTKSAGFDLAEDFFFFLIGYPAMVTLLGALHTAGGGLLQPLWLLGGILASSLCRRRFRAFGLYLLLELGLTGAVTALSLLSGGIAAALLGGAGMLITFGVSIHRFFTVLSADDPRYDPEAAAAYRPYIGHTVLAVGVVVLLITDIASLILHRDRGWLCTACLLILLAGYAVYDRRRGESALLAGGTEGSGAFRRLNRHINSLLAVLCLGGGGLLYALFRAVGLDGVDRSLADWLRSLPSREPSAQQQTASSAASSSPASLRPRLPQNIQASHNAALAALGGALKLIFLILAGAIVIFVLAALGISVIRLLRYRRSEGPDVKRTPAPAKTAVSRLRKGPLAAIGRIAGTGNRVRIRRVYSRMVRRAIRAGIKIAPSDTPAQIAEKLGAGPAVMRATALYEKARYAAGDCSRDDVAEMKRCAAAR